MSLLKLPLMIALLLLVSGCAVQDRPALERPPLTLAAPPTAIIEGTCDDRAVLDNWLQAISFRQEEFLSLMQTTPGKTREEIYADVEAMAALRDLVNTEPVPDCGVEAQQALSEIMSRILVYFQAYVNGEPIDLAQVVNESLPDYTAAQALLDEPLARLNQLYGLPTP
ncbi:MAG: hypothetical protein SF029_24790 [bacterium]|nr:hypothetical protein [bacterium]